MSAHEGQQMFAPHTHKKEHRLAIPVGRHLSTACCLALTTSLLLGCGGGGGDPPIIVPPPGKQVPTLVSGPSPFVPGCTVATNPGEILATNGEVDGSIAVNPTNPKNLVGIWKQDRWEFGGGAGLLIATTRDSGKTWTRRTPHFSACSGGTSANGGNYERAADPSITFGPDGVAYA